MLAGYSGTPLARKLGIKPGARLLRIQPPDGLEDWMTPLPRGVVACPEGEQADVILFFTTEERKLREHFGELAARLDFAGGLWIGWPKKSARVPTDLDGKRVREVGLAAGLVDNKVCAISETWSGLRFVYRLEDRPRG